MRPQQTRMPRENRTYGLDRARTVWLNCSRRSGRLESPLSTHPTRRRSQPTSLCEVHREGSAAAAGPRFRLSPHHLWLAAVLLFTALTARASSAQTLVTVRSRPWTDPYNQLPPNIKFIDAGTITIPPGYEILSVETQLGSADTNDVFTPDSSTTRGFPVNPPVLQTTQSVDFGYTRPVNTPNPPLPGQKWTVATANPPNPPHPAGNRWAIKAIVKFRKAQSGPMPPGPTPTATHVGYP